MSSDRGNPVGRAPPARLLEVVGTAAVLALLLVRARARTAGFGWRAFLRPAVTRELIPVAYYDLVYVTAVSGAFVVALLLARRRPRLQRTFAWLYVGVAVLSLIMALVNEMALRELGRPLTYQWLYYADFMRSIDAYNAMQGLATRYWMISVAQRCALLLVGSYLVGRGLRWLAGRLAFRLAAAALVGGLCVLLGLGHFSRSRAASDVARLQNPVVALIASAFQTGDKPLLTTMRTSVPPDDFVPFGARPASGDALGTALRERARRMGVRNVLIVALESVAAEYADPYGAPYGATPQLDRYRRSAMLFTRAYVHVPSTIHSLISLLLSVYPPLTFRTLTAEHPRVRLPSVSGEFQRRGYRTAFFNSADNRFQRGDVFLQAHGFDRLEDYHSLGCGGKVFRASTKDWPFLDGTRDECTGDRLAAWVGGGSGAPFFAVLWTMQTHFPYFVTDEPQQFAVHDSSMNRYLNALRESDRAVGRLLSALQQRGVLDSTLVVLVGDHGETFGRHGHHVHSELYEEEVHVPLMLINRRLFHGETDSTLGGLIDLAPTIMDLMGYPSPESWQGRSLFDEHRTGRVYLFAAYSRVLFGYREGTRKFIYDASANAPELYDLQTDPEESRNLAEPAPGFGLLARQRLAAWVQYQQRFLGKALVPDTR